MTPCIGPYSPVAAIWRKFVENASIRPTMQLAVLRSAISAVLLRVQDLSRTAVFTQDRRSLHRGPGNLVRTMVRRRP
jgi:hypothetical protein